MLEYHSSRLNASHFLSPRRRHVLLFIFSSLFSNIFSVFDVFTSQRFLTFSLSLIGKETRKEVRFQCPQVFQDLIYIRLYLQESTGVGRSVN